ncbi:hypothetical protein MANES_10G116901v8 [Manihot esculenta]|uniref:Uncharacterized protein n=1 Tax=Manihot esculenta TaxID=3983 RepID=A0ACB7H1I5_MANES|nr:hypothetical protein MANES_10G116901v8 [Manihot esculenta]
MAEPGDQFSDTPLSSPLQAASRTCARSDSSPTITDLALWISSLGSQTSSLSLTQHIKLQQICNPLLPFLSLLGEL